MLKISELRQRKQDLENELSKLIQKFESETHVQVEGLISVSHETDAEKTVVVQVNIHLNI